MNIVIDESSFVFKSANNILQVCRNGLPVLMEDEINCGKLNIKKYAYSASANRELKEHLPLYRKALEKYKMLISLL